jgi:hypothetical protein
MSHIARTHEREKRHEHKEHLLQDLERSTLHEHDEHVHFRCAVHLGNVWCALTPLGVPVSEIPVDASWGMHGQVRMPLIAACMAACCCFCRSHRSPWLRAFVLGALDGLVSVACTIVGVSGGDASLGLMRLTGISAWVACAMAMAMGEWVSVASQKVRQPACLLFASRM